ncbi:ricin-type beta-trefoil lectin domain protein [Silvanigrella aquatica]|uniref:Uncharacterized protein n=1 Tax=Silvanigrella aquatica TaxID=1915309 RepID=A0A1L4CYS2_9BACT|nr:ricin-type beta-trefoil lectin domain protein [Silvanigrella aquatica]APJ03087.1 hypothetical protein AXG55_03850 [Silvanigrella aquatica]
MKNVFFVFILCLIGNFFEQKNFLKSTAACAQNNERSPPKVVYRASPSKPDIKFKEGFRRGSQGSRDLASHILGDGQVPGITTNFAESSIFISTTSSLVYAHDYGDRYALGTWEVSEFYIYEIVPEAHFVDVTATFERTLQAEIDPQRRIELERRRNEFIDEYEFSAIEFIRPESILSATRYVFNNEDFRYHPVEIIPNANAERNLIPTVHENNFSLGTIRNHNFEHHLPTLDFACYRPDNNTGTVSFVVLNSNSHREKRELNMQSRVLPKLICPDPQFLQKKERIENPTSFLERTKSKINITSFEMKLCLIPDNKYLYGATCDTNSALWSFTEFGQLITKIFDGQYDQYYCLTAPRNSQDSNYVKLEICDLNTKEQRWTLQSDKNSFKLLSSANETLHLYNNYYAYTQKKIDYYRVVNLNNSFEIKKNKTSAFIQFSVDPLYTADYYTIYPTEHGNIYEEYFSDLSNYSTFFNAHNNTLFSSYGHNREGPQVCYISSSVRKESVSWEWVKNEYCPTGGFVENQYKWLFQVNQDHSKFQIMDYVGNILRLNDNYGSQNRYFAYTAFRFWNDRNRYVDSFIFKDALQIYARKFVNFDIEHGDKEFRKIQAYNAVKNYFRESFQLQ